MDEQPSEVQVDQALKELNGRIEATIQLHAARRQLAPGAVFRLDISGERILLVVQVPRLDGPPVAALRRMVRTAPWCRWTPGAFPYPADPATLAQIQVEYRAVFIPAKTIPKLDVPGYFELDVRVPVAVASFVDGTYLGNLPAEQANHLPTSGWSAA